MDGSQIRTARLALVVIGGAKHGSVVPSAQGDDLGIFLSHGQTEVFKIQSGILGHRQGFGFAEIRS